MWLFNNIYNYPVGKTETGLFESLCSMYPVELPSYYEVRMCLITSTGVRLYQRTPRVATTKIETVN